VNKEIAKIMLKTVSKYTAIFVGFVAFTIGLNHLIQWLFGVNTMEATLIVLVASLLVISVAAAYDYAKWKVDFDAKYGNK
jgi:hypothetical protein